MEELLDEGLEMEEDDGEEDDTEEDEVDIAMVLRLDTDEVDLVSQELDVDRSIELDEELWVERVEVEDGEEILLKVMVCELLVWP